ncbi:Structure-specific endonuclease subunit SLX4 [Bienertia sinuspersici]
MWRRLQTKDILVKYGIGIDDVCPLCQLTTETVEHLFFRCPYSHMCFRALCKKIDHSITVSSLSEFSSWISKPVRGRTRSQVLQCCFVNLIYHIWPQCNSTIWKKVIMLLDKLVDVVRSQCYWRIVGVLPSKTSQRDRDWISTILN